MPRATPALPARRRRELAEGACPARSLPSSGAKGRRGGRRPGAGAPKGNLNALRTGARSKQLKAVVIALLVIPETRRVLMHFSRMEHRRRAVLQDALNRGACPERSRRARLLQLPSRERTIKAVRHRRNRKAVEKTKTISDRKELA